ncbi:unnamed protein product [[Candida] boidinii]|nr:unnamed protein product [[Candida] boidinii]
MEMHKWHQEKLEIVLRLLENDILSPEEVLNIQDDVKYFLEENQDTDFMNDDTIYDDLNLDQEALVQEVHATLAGNTSMTEEIESSRQNSRSDKQASDSISSSSTHQQQQKIDESKNNTHQEQHPQQQQQQPSQQQQQQQQQQPLQSHPHSLQSQSTSISNSHRSTSSSGELTAYGSNTTTTLKPAPVPVGTVKLNWSAAVASAPIHPPAVSSPKTKTLRLSSSANTNNTSNNKWQS